MCKTKTTAHFVTFPYFHGVNALLLFQRKVMGGNQFFLSQHYNSDSMKKTLCSISLIYVPPDFGFVLSYYNSRRCRPFNRTNGEEHDPTLRGP